MFAPGVIRMTTARAASAASYAATRQRASQRALVSAFLHADAIVRVPTSLARTSFSTTSAACNASSRAVRSIGTPAVARASGLRAAWRLVPGTLSRADGLRAVSIRCLCASAKVRSPRHACALWLYCVVEQTWQHPSSPHVPLSWAVWQCRGICGWQG